jgi:hypothetical protein
LTTRWVVEDYGDVHIEHTGFGDPHTVLIDLSKQLERAIAYGIDIQERLVDSYPLKDGTRRSCVKWKGKVPLKHVADIREFLMGITVKNVHL